MEKLEKKQWEVPALETLNISETMYGQGTTQIDFVTTEDMDITQPS